MAGNTTTSPETALLQVEAALGSPAYRAPGIRIYQADCLELVPRLRGESIDLTVTSPPYNIGKEYEVISALDDYVAWCERWISEVHRVSSANGAFWLNLGYVSLPGRAKAIPIPYLLWERVPFFLQQEVVWHYGAGVASRKTLSPRNEKFLWYVKNSESYVFNLDEIRDPNVKYPNQKKNGKLKCNPQGKNPTDVWTFPKVTSGRNRSSKERTAHPAQYPVAVIDRIIKGCSSPGELVLDPFMGSGTTAESCLRNGRAVIGIELNSEYVDLTAARLERARQEIESEQAQQKLFGLEQRQ